jgi:hypothetical protein
MTCERESSTVHTWSFTNLSTRECITGIMIMFSEAISPLLTISPVMILLHKQHLFNSHYQTRCCSFLLGSSSSTTPSSTSLFLIRVLNPIESSASSGSDSVYRSISLTSSSIEWSCRAARIRSRNFSSSSRFLMVSVALKPPLHAMTALYAILIILRNHFVFNYFPGAYRLWSVSLIGSE